MLFEVEGFIVSSVLTASHHMLPCTPMPLREPKEHQKALRDPTNHEVSIYASKSRSRCVCTTDGRSNRLLTKRQLNGRPRGRGPLSIRHALERRVFHRAASIAETGDRAVVRPASKLLLHCLRQHWSIDVRVCGGF
jgi:hypothetical protein